MALTQCSNCGKNMSDRAEQCPHCGAIPPKYVAQCAECGTPLSKSDAICPSCGHPTSWSRECPECGQFSTIDTEICPECGFDLFGHFGRVNTVANTLFQGQSRTQVENNDSEYIDDECLYTQSKKKNYLIAAGVVVILGVAIYFFLSWQFGIKGSWHRYISEDVETVWTFEADSVLKIEVINHSNNKSKKVLAKYYTNGDTILLDYFFNIVDKWPENGGHINNKGTFDDCLVAPLDENGNIGVIDFQYKIPYAVDDKTLSIGYDYEYKFTRDIQTKPLDKESYETCNYWSAIYDFAEEISEARTTTTTVIETQIEIEPTQSASYRQQAPSWVKGTWTYTIDSPYGSLGSYRFVIDDTSIDFYEDGRYLRSENYQYSDGYLCGNSLTIMLLPDIKEIKWKDYYFRKSGGGSSSGSEYFTSAYSVIGWLSDKTFYYGSNSLSIRQDGIYFNGNYVGGAPIVDTFTSSSAIVIATSTQTGGHLTFRVNSANGTVSQGGDIYSL